jgi:hypothetical protein
MWHVNIAAEIVIHNHWSQLTSPHISITHHWATSISGTASMQTVLDHTLTIRLYCYHTLLTWCNILLFDTLASTLTSAISTVCSSPIVISLSTHPGLQDTLEWSLQMTGHCSVNTITSKMGIVQFVQHQGPGVLGHPEVNNMCITKQANVWGHGE